MENIKVSTWSDAEETPILGFGAQDLKVITFPHNDDLVIRATLANYEATRIFMNVGSSVNILFKKAINQMQLAIRELQLIATSLYGFAGNEVRPLGQTHLLLSLREEPQR